MNREEIIARLKPIIKVYVDDKSSLDHLDESTDFIKDLKINSANLVDIVLDVEEEFAIEIDNTAMEKMLSVGASIAVIEQKLADK
ncbi:acyl carrier protein [Pedobacter frigoris]|uniref:Acyl carrier protein n=1 Tax=Pedobacter frigoris TaxID=2571272 RepID=A0A4U1CTQ8_9SPHI|nr:phosphopantetheine-binding protein [Pedobacter frigoris]TKC09138.1 acyl carrier protein [Pedobacter frigoris]